MFELVKKSLYLSLGVASLTKDRLQQIVGDVTKEAKLSEDEGRRFAEEVEAHAEESKKELGNEIEKRIDQAFVQLGLLKAGVKKVTDRTTDALQKLVDQRVDAALEKLKIARQEEIEELKNRIALLEGKAGAPGSVEVVE